VSSVILIYVLVWLVLMVFFAVGTAWFQGYIYSEPVSDLYWRAPAAGTAVTLVLALWGWLDYRTGGGYRTWFDFSPYDVKVYNELWAIRAGQKTAYKLERNSAGRTEYHDDTKRLLPSRPDAILVVEDGEEIRFEPERDAQGKFKTAQGSYLQYIDPRGRAMSENLIGEVSTLRGGLLFGYILINVLHLVTWFGCLWLLLQYQWSHALGLAVIFWLVTSLLVMQGILKNVEEGARKQVVQQSAAIVLPPSTKFGI
jgi:hypothetical protein